MGYPLGLAPIETASGDIRGTTPDGMQRLLGSRWGNPGIIAGCQVVGGNDMLWHYKAGAVVVSTGVGLAVEVPLESGTIAALPAPATGSRRDYIYVTATTGTNGDLVGQVRIGSEMATPGTTIASALVPAGATSTAQMGVDKAQRFALPVTASTGKIAEWRDDYGQDVPYDGPEWTAFQGTLPIFPTDRELELRITQSISTARYNDPYKWDRGIYKHRIKLNGVSKFDFAAEYTDAWEPKTFILPLQVAANTQNTITYTEVFAWGSKPYRFVSGVDAGIQIWDKGAIQ
ncbi:hypothetical protein [Propionimicrobium sp. PCR01-08-3]|uniref:hypothetical protein n=1 Tax=Propionimicrobium sp. PCR01-08-3 TaxID=3052086 RepID=UPI00255CA94C|nr:hypothetical protein [Propionimicrobium sp. PCR01-08-3]WIY84339.1 hypothetical protein QQ658_15115 [Propionimicrobium sp. PCR01-08-3]